MKSTAHCQASEWAQLYHPACNLWYVANLCSLLPPSTCRNTLPQDQQQKSEKQSSPATHHGGTWRDRRYSSYSFLTLALDGGWVVSVTPRPRFAPGNGLLVSIVHEAGWASDPIWTQRLEKVITRAATVFFNSWAAYNDIRKKLQFLF
jgi:hypothetical protein